VTIYAYGNSNVDQKAYNRGRLGDATSEVVKLAGSGWNDDYASFALSSSSWFGRGGRFSETTGAGIFYFIDYSSTGSSVTYRGTRASLVVFPQ